MCCLLSVAHSTQQGHHESCCTSETLELAANTDDRNREKSKKVGEGEIQNGIHEAILLKWVQVQLWNACGSSSVRRLSGGHNTRSDRSQDYNQEHPRGSFLPAAPGLTPSSSLPSPESPREGYLDTAASWGRVSRHKDRGHCTYSPLRQPHLSAPAFALTFDSTCSKTKLVFLASIHSSESSNKKDAERRDPFSFWVKCWKENSQIHSKVTQTSSEEGTDQT